MRVNGKNIAFALAYTAPRARRGLERNDRTDQVPLHGRAMNRIAERLRDGRMERASHWSGG
jgi:hypothetical protein